MPRQHVYGKRSRAIYDPSAIFSSPQRAEKFTAKAIASARVTRVVDCLRDLQISEQPEKYRDTSNGSSQRMRRVALGKRSTNSVVNPDFSIETKTIKSEKQKVKTVVQERKLCMEGGGNKFGRHAEVPEQSIGRKLPEEDRPAPLELEGYMKNDRSGNAVIPETINDAKIPTNALHRSTQGRLRKEEAKTNQRDQVDSHTPTDSTLSKFPELQPEKNIYTEHCRSLLKLSSHSLTSFSDWSEQLSHHFTLSKIAEASFGEVYRISLLHPIPGLSAGDESVFKVIALRAPPATLPSDKRKRKAAMKKADAMSSPDEVANEVLVLQRMRSIPGFTNYRDVRIVQGRPPILFVEAFRAFNRTQRAAKKDPSIFPDPGRKGSYSPDQLWAVIEMQDAGTDLEHLIDQDVASKATVAPGSLHALSSIWTVWDIFWQVVLALAKGEEGAEFEHRDLHLGNICVREATNHKTLSSLIRKAGEDDSIDVTRKLGFTRWEITLIDYTISRCRLVQFSPSSDTSRDGIAFADLALHASLFDGDATEEYQYEIYRYMRDAFFSSGLSGSRNDPARYKRDEGPQSSQKREWQEYNPITNLVWLHFILHKLLAQLSRPSLQHAPPTAKKYRLTHMQWKRANDLEHALDRLSRLLNPEVLVRGGDGFLTSASDVVGLALGEGWLDVADVLGATDIGDTEASMSESDDKEIEGILREKKPREFEVRVDLMEKSGLKVTEEQTRAEAAKSTQGQKARSKRV